MRKSYLYIFFLIFILFQACRSTRNVTETPSEKSFSKSNKNALSILHTVPGYNHPLISATGKAKVIVSQPGSVERGTIFFTADRKQTLFTFKNGLGIEGGRLYFNRDSVLVYNRIDKYARKMSLLDYSYVYLNGIEPINPLDVLSPGLKGKKVSKMTENATAYSITFKDKTHILVNRQSHLIKKIVYPSDLAGNFNTIELDGYAKIQNYFVPRKIQILSSDKKSNIFLLIQSLNVNPEKLNFNIKIPSRLKIERQ